ESKYQSLTDLPAIPTVAYRIRHKDGHYVWLETTCRPVRDEMGKVTTVHAVSRDVTERRRAEERIRASLREKEVLIKEVQHRVKNNLQVICSLLTLQSGHVRDPHARGMLMESRQRVHCMALIHEKLYRSNDLSRINFADYLRALTSNLFLAYGGAGRPVRLET